MHSIHPNPIHFPVLLHLPSTATAPPSKKKKKIKEKAHPSFQPLHVPFVCLWGLGSCCVSHSVPFGSNSFTCKRCNVLLFRFKASGFCYTVSTGPSLKLLSDSLWLPWVMDVLPLWFFRTSPLNALQQVIDWADAGMGKLKALNVVLGGGWVDQSGPPLGLIHPLRWGAGPAPILRPTTDPSQCSFVPLTVTCLSHLGSCTWRHYSALLFLDLHFLFSCF